MSATLSTASPDFADVYAQNLDKVWRFVHARIRDPHESHDVTADVFVRAWRSWDRYDPPRGAVEPWLFTIAYRTLADRFRRGSSEDPYDPSDLPEGGQGRTPEHDVLRDELLAQLAQALDGLSQRERDGLALRFAARLSMQHVADVLGTSVSAAKMMIHRAVRTLEEQVHVPASPAQAPADLERVIDDVLARGHETLGQSELHGLLVHLVAVHDQPTPAGLSEHVATCVQCTITEDLDDDGTGSGPPAGPSGGSRGAAPASLGARIRARLASAIAALFAFAGVCLACTIPALQTLFVAVGVGAAGYYLHLVGLAGAPLVVWLVWRVTRRHGVDRGYRWVRRGAIVLAVHALIHVPLVTVDGGSVPGWLEATGGLAFVATDWVGTGMLIAGASLNLVDLQRWRRDQAAGLRMALAT